VAVVVHGPATVKRNPVCGKPRACKTRELQRANGGVAEKKAAAGTEPNL